MMNDWTYDLFHEDSIKYKATPIKGVYPRSTADEREQFMVWFKNAARDFEETWNKTHAHRYDRYDGWIGDAFARTLGDLCFSDYYKDTYNQRPHLPTWFYVTVTGLPMEEDTIRTFCANPIRDAVENAKEIRMFFERKM